MGVSLGTGVQGRYSVCLSICALYVWVSLEISGLGQRHGVDYGITGSSGLPIVPIAWDHCHAASLRQTRST